MANPIKRGFSKLAQFSGRDTRGEFWPYVGAIFALVFVLNFVLMGALMASAMADVMAYAAEHPQSTTVHSAPGQYSIQIDGDAPGAPVPDFTAFFIGFPIMLVVTVALLAAAVTRRLHDTNRAGFWGLMPVPFLALAMGVMPLLMRSVMAGGEPDFSLFGLLFVNNIVYLAALATLIILLAQKGTPGPNRYGAATSASYDPRPVDDWGRSS